MPLRLLPLCLLLVLGAVPASAAASAALPGAESADAVRTEDGGHAVHASLLVDAAIAAAGEPFSVGVLFELAPGWHIYWKNSGQAGLPTRLAWQAEGAEFGPLQWPAPRVFRESEASLTTFGYDGEILLRSDAVLAANAPGQVVLRAKADFLVCKLQCVPGSFELERALAVGRDAVPAEPATQATFMRYASRVPRPAAELGVELEALYSRSAVRPGDAFTGAIAVAGAYAFGEGSAFHSFAPADSEALALEVTGSRPHPYADFGLLLTFRGEAAVEGPEVSRLRGVIALRDAAYRPLWAEVDLPLPRASAGAEVAVRPAPWLEPLHTASGSGFFWRAILLALAGGLVLNLMPCVLPVLAIKVFALTDLAQRSPGEVRLHGAAYAGGVVASMLALAGAVVALRAGGTAVGWGFQFQEPLFLAVISAVLVVFGLNLFGVFEIGFDATRLAGVGHSASGPRRSFFEGLLAVALATPCSAPFLGTAVGFAFASTPATIVAIFAAIGVGLASPYVAITLVPAWARLLPKSGAWMVWLRRGLGFALLATVVWLLWVAGRAVGSDGVAGLLAFLLAVGFAAWLYGAFQSARLPRSARLTAAGALAAALLALPLLPLEPAAPRGPSEARNADAASHAFEPVAVRAAVERGQVAFVYFTADWCLTCKVNEHVVLADAEVRDAMRSLDVARFVGDWTRRDERIRAELARFGRAGVPMYLVYSPGRPADPVLLPELLTVDLVVDALRAAAGEAGALRAGRSTP